MPPKISAAERLARRNAVKAAREAASVNVYNNIDVGGNNNNNNAPAPVLPVAAASVPVSALAAAANNHEEAKNANDDVEEAKSPAPSFSLTSSSIPSSSSASVAARDQTETMRIILQQLEELRKEVREELQKEQGKTSNKRPHSPSSDHTEECVDQPVAASSSSTSSRIASSFFRPKLQDLSEYHGASSKLDGWLAEVRTMNRICKMNQQETVEFAAARMRGAALHWWEGMTTDAQAAITDTTSLAAALRKRFQPITTSETARAQLRKLQQSNRSTDDYILEFQELYAKVTDMSSADALFDFMHGLHKATADQLRIQGVKTIDEAYEKAAHVSGVTSTHSHPAPAANHNINNIQIDDSSSTTQQQQYTRNNRGGGRGGYRGGRVPFNRGAEGQQRAPPTTAPLIPQAVREKRREQGACFRCGQSGHMARACPNAVSIPLN
jgi:hypothetical protein